MELKKLLLGAAVSAAAVGTFGGAAYGGEITGGPNPKSTPVQEHLAASICSFSGRDAVDGSAVDPEDADDGFWPGDTQSFGQIVRQFGGPVPGGAGADCQPGGGE